MAENVRSDELVHLALVNDHVQHRGVGFEIGHGEDLEDGHRIVQMLLSAVTECADSQSYVPVAKIRMMENIPKFTAALIGDRQVLRDAKERLSASNLGEI
ncbi:MAG: hypothetical protein JWP06_52 [Candidatus Saccharibacteria bacterium]|nr:hypothetical protein [Candidatus Saccharibacteria bacterium]